MSALGIALGYASGYTAAIFTVVVSLVAIGTIASILIGKSLGAFIFGFFLTAIMVWVSAIFHFLGGIAGMLVYKIVCETGVFGISCDNASWNDIYAVGSLIGALVILCWIVASIVLDEIKFDVNADMTVTVDNKKHYPGDDVLVRVNVASREEFYFRRGVVRLVSWEIIHTEKGPMEQALWSSVKRFGNSTKLTDNQAHSEEIAITLPKTWETNYDGVNWGVRVTLNVPGGKDIQGGQKISVSWDGAPVPA